MKTKLKCFRTHLLIGVALCAAALFVLVGCPDGTGTNAAVRPVITLSGTNPLLLDIGAVLSESDFGATAASANDPAYAGPVIVAITNSSGTTVPTIDTAILGSYIVTYTAPADAAGNTPLAVVQMVQVGDATSPVITLVGNNPLLIPIGGTFTDPGATVIDNDPNYPTTMATPMITDPTGIEIITISTAVAGTYTITYTAPADAAGNTPTAVTLTVRVVNPIDEDNDLLIDINTLDDLNAIHNNLEGTSYRAIAGGTELLCGIDGTTKCIGYELMHDLNFDTPASYASGTVNPAWRPTGGDPDTATNAGWDPIGSCNDDTTDADSFRCGDSDDDPFTATFEGNGFTIANLYVRRGGDVGLFGVSSGTIEGIGIVNALLYTAAVSTNATGGLVGRNAGTITASYATGDVDTVEGINTSGGLVGFNTATGTITASYATGNVDGGNANDTIGGLVGENDGTITASYATGNVDGRIGTSDFVGGLVGDNNGTITASYATGDADRGAGSDDIVGLLVGHNNDGTTVASYGFGTRTNAGSGTVHQNRSTDASMSAAVATACDITQANSSTLTTTPDNRWDPTQWDFGTTMQRPVVLYEGVVVRGQEDRRC